MEVLNMRVPVMHKCPKCGQKIVSVTLISGTIHGNKENNLYRCNKCNKTMTHKEWINSQC